MVDGRDVDSAGPDTGGASTPWEQAVTALRRASNARAAAVAFAAALDAMGARGVLFLPRRDRLQRLTTTSHTFATATPDLTGSHASSVRVLMSRRVGRVRPEVAQALGIPSPVPALVRQVEVKGQPVMLVYVDFEGASPPARAHTRLDGLVGLTQDVLTRAVSNIRRGAQGKEAVRVQVQRTRAPARPTAPRGGVVEKVRSSAVTPEVETAPSSVPDWEAAARAYLAAEGETQTIAPDAAKQPSPRQQRERLDASQKAAAQARAQLRREQEAAAEAEMARRIEEEARRAAEARAFAEGVAAAEAAAAEAAAAEKAEAERVAAQERAARLAAEQAAAEAERAAQEEERAQRLAAEQERAAEAKRTAAAQAVEQAPAKTKAPDASAGIPAPVTPTQTEGMPAFPVVPNVAPGASGVVPPAPSLEISLAPGPVGFEPAAPLLPPESESRTPTSKLPAMHGAEASTTAGDAGSPELEIPREDTAPIRTGSTTRAPRRVERGGRRSKGTLQNFVPSAPAPEERAALLEPDAAAGARALGDELLLPDLDPRGWPQRSPATSGEWAAAFDGEVDVFAGAPFDVHDDEGDDDAGVSSPQPVVSRSSQAQASAGVSRDDAETLAARPETGPRPAATPVAAATDAESSGPRLAPERPPSESSAADPVLATLADEVVDENDLLTAIYSGDGKALAGAHVSVVDIVFRRFPGRLEADLKSAPRLSDARFGGPLLRAVVGAGDRMIPWLTEALMSPSPDVRYYAALCFRGLRDRSCVLELVTRLFDPDPDVARVCAQVLGAYREDEELFAEVRIALRAGLHLPQRSAVAAIVRALGHMGDAELVASLIDQLEDAGEVGLEARRALALLTGQDLGRHVSSWHRWYARGRKPGTSKSGTSQPRV